jgi:UPF0042 nucleotide-binding protein
VKVVLITGISGSGKSVALKALEDQGFFCIDNLPPDFLAQVVHQLEKDGRPEAAVSIDARNVQHLKALPAVIQALKAAGHQLKVLYLDADTETLVARYSESRRRHPASYQLGDTATIQECVDFERDALSVFDTLGDRIDTTALLPNILRLWIEQAVVARPSRLTLVLESFAYKRGVPIDADLMFDARCLPNPFYDKTLRPKSGKDVEVANFFANHPSAEDLINDIEQFVRKWLPKYINEQRSYLTIAVGCTGGQHRSVFVTEQLLGRLQQHMPQEVQTVLIRHRSMVAAPQKT